MKDLEEEGGKGRRRKGREKRHLGKNAIGGHTNISPICKFNIYLIGFFSCCFL